MKHVRQLLLKVKDLPAIESPGMYVLLVILSVVIIRIMDISMLHDL